MTEIYCNRCGSLEQDEVKTPELKHYSKLVCKDCGAFIKWVSDPNSHTYKEKCKFLLDLFDDSDDFVNKQKKWFKEKGFLSEKQFKCLEDKFKARR
jgi:hypothetical protein